MQSLIPFFFLYIAAISLFAAVLTVYDKIASRKLPTHRIRERTLVILAILGGAAAELLTMTLIRHKTKHRGIIANAIVFTVLWTALWGYMLYFVLSANPSFFTEILSL